MGKINVLDKHTAELIAAGEVVERPASVIKELVENAIDSGSSAVTVEIKNGGITFMRVTDAGCGIAREDVPVAFLRHATSKISKEQDLDHIGTLGFRGEALASIAAVARVEILTRTAGELAGTRYLIEGGEEKLCTDAGCAEGTTIVVRDLFYNTPARMKFLKKDVSEANAVAAVMDRIALSHPEISVKFIRDGKEELHTPGDNNPKSCVFAVYGKEFTAGLMPVNYELAGVKVTGFICRPSAARPNRSMQHFFLNGRFVKCRTAMVALEEAFKGSIMVGKFPSCVLYISLSLEAVDVNVHPAKTEVRFANEKPVFDAVYHGVKTALHTADAPKQMPLTKPVSPFQYTVQPQAEQLSLKAIERTIDEEPAAKPHTGNKPASTKAPLIYTVPVAEEPIKNLESERPLQQESTIVRDSVQTFYREAPVIYYPPALPVKPIEYEPIKAAPQPKPEPEVYAPQADAGIKTALIGEAFNTYIILENGKDELVFIDKHAAHERLIYEQLKEQGKSFAQMLLEPVTVTLDKNEYAAVLDSLPLLSRAGFEMEDFGAGTVLVRSAPVFLEQADIAASVMEIAGYLVQNKKDITTEHLDWLYHNVACRAAIKAGDESRKEELIALAKRLYENPDVRYCPHGRPVFVVIKRRELEKQFGRV